jgi:hypothetical protein
MEHDNETGIITKNKKKSHLPTTNFLLIFNEFYFIMGYIK